MQVRRVVMVLRSKLPFILVTAWLAGVVIASSLGCSKSADPGPTTEGSSNLAASPGESVASKVPTGSGSGGSLVEQTDDRATQAAKLNEKGKDLVFAGKFEEAASMFRDAIALVGEPIYYFNLATALYQAGRFDESLVSVKAALGAKPSAAQVEKILRLRDQVLNECTAQGIACGAESKAEQATRLYEQGIELMTQNKFEEARQHFKNAIALDPQEKFVFGLATAQYQSGRLREAATSLESLRIWENPTMTGKVDRLRTVVLARCKERNVDCTSRQ